MSKSIEVSASILCADFANLGDAIKESEAAGVDRFHIDVMDGFFVPNITIGPVIVEAVRRYTDKPVEAHLMIENPGRYIDDYINAGADIVQIQAECYGTRRDHCQAFDDYPKEIDLMDIEAARRDLQKIRKQNKQAYMVLNPGTPVCIKDVLDELDGILIMSVNPGFAKQKFIDSVLDKVKDLRKVYDGDIEIDGGIKAETAPAAVDAGVNVLVTASYFYGSSDKAQAVDVLKSLSPKG